MERYRIERLAAWIFVGAAVSVGVYVGAKYVLGAFLPFILAWGFAFLVRPAACTLSRRLHLPNRLATVLLVVVFWAALFFVLWLICGKLLGELRSFLLYIQQNPHVYTDFLGRIEGWIAASRRWLPSGTTVGSEGSLESYLSSALPGLIGRALQLVSSLAGRVLLSLPGILLFLLVTVIASVYASLELPRINRAVLSLLPPSLRDKARQARENLFFALGRYARSYLALMGLTFLLLLAGFWVIRVRYAFLLAAIFAVVDLLPILGVGTVLVPWGLFCLASGQGRLGVSLLVLYAVVAVIRQLAEPKLVGESLGVPPLLMLIYLYAGLTLFGLWGVILAPLAALLTRSFLSGGLEKIIKNAPSAQP